MKAKLLKQLRKQAHNSFRIAPDYFEGKYCIQTVDLFGRWHCLQNLETKLLSLEEAVERLAKERDDEFHLLAMIKIRERRYRKELNKTKDL